jgi:hypothetical protein
MDTQLEIIDKLLSKGKAARNAIGIVPSFLTEAMHQPTKKLILGYAPIKNRATQIGIEHLTDILNKPTDMGYIAHFPRYIPAWVLSQEADAASHISYVRGMPADPSPNIGSFNRKDCSLILFEIEFCRDIGCHKKLDEKFDKYNPLFSTLRR